MEAQIRELLTWARVLTKEKQQEQATLNEIHEMQQAHELQRKLIDDRLNGVLLILRSFERSPALGTDMQEWISRELKRVRDGEEEEVDEDDPAWEERVTLAPPHWWPKAHGE